MSPNNTDSPNASTVGVNMGPLTPRGDRASMERLQDANTGAELSSKQQPKGSSVFRVFSLASRVEQFGYALGIICSAASGTILPLMTLVFGKFVTIFTQFATGGIDSHHFQSHVNQFTLYFIYFFVARAILTYTSMVLFTIISTNITSKMQTRYLHVVLRQPIAYHDTSLASGDVNQALSMHANAIRSGLSDKLGMTVQHVSTVLTAFVVATTTVWKLSLAVLTVVPAAVIILGITSTWDEKLTTKTTDLKADATTLADEIFGSIRIVRSLGAVDKLTAKYARLLTSIKQTGWKRAPIFGLQVGVYMFLLYTAYALAFWYGIRLYALKEVGASGKVITTLFSVMIGLNSFSQLATYLGLFISTTTSIRSLFETIDLEPPDVFSFKGPKRERSDVPLHSAIQFKNVSFEYPGRPGAKVLKSFNLDLPHGKRTALVGTSGCGKSTCVGLLLRWYEPEEGDITVGNDSINRQNITKWRAQIGLVQQEPQLFSATVYENVVLGLEGTSYQTLSEDEKMNMVVEACKVSHAHEFISGLSNGYHTFLGEKGANLSGGQKQRLALARAVVKNPPILIFDEATSALDNKSEALVQKAIDAVSQNRTIVAISHRLSSIRDYDKIVVMSSGSVLEQGTHEKLLQVDDGAYRKLWNAQALTDEKAAPRSSHDDNARDNMTTLEEANNSPAIHGKGAIQEPSAKQPRLVPAIMRVLRRARRFWSLYIALAIAAAIGGALYPVQAILYAKSVDAFQKHGHQLQSAADFWGLMWFILAVVVAFGYFCIGAVGTGLGESISQDFRSSYIVDLVRLPIAYFDTKENSPMTVVHRLATQPDDINSLAGSNLAVLVTVLVSLIGTIIVGFVTGWKFTLVVLAAALPAIFVASYIRESMEHEFESSSGKVFETCTAFAIECIQAIRTVCSLNMESYVERRFLALLDEHGKRAKIHALSNMVWFALSESIEFLCMGFAFWYGGKLLSEHEYTTEQFFIIFIAVVFGSQSMGQYFAHSLDISKGVDAVCAIQEVEAMTTHLGQQLVVPLPGIDEDGHTPLIEFRNVSFAYPARPDYSVLKGFNMKIYAGQFVAFVGESGSGKSTLIGLLERFYEPLSGEIFVNGVPIQNIPNNDLIRLISLVTQEPTLYSGTVEENMLLGVSEDLSQEDLDGLSGMAQLSELIASLPEGYKTQVGVKGSRLSGGQRQRVAIARAWARKSPVMLLDEATSALDSESEKLIQHAIFKNRDVNKQTVIAIAHRLSTIRDADVIFVLHEGRIAETGNHGELMQQGGRYFYLATRAEE